MFGINLSEFFVIGILALILIGPKQLPEVARTIGRFMNELKRGADVFTNELKSQVKEDIGRDYAKNPLPLYPPGQENNPNLAVHDSERLEKEHQDIIKPQPVTKDPNEKDS